MKNASSRLYSYLLSKLDEEPIAARATLCDDLAEFVPNQNLARRLREHAQTLRKIERDAKVMRLAVTMPRNNEHPHVF